LIWVMLVACSIPRGEGTGSPAPFQVEACGGRGCIMELFDLVDVDGMHHPRGWRHRQFCTISRRARARFFVLGVLDLPAVGYSNTSYS
jgi:hypothetical protein